MRVQDLLRHKGADVVTVEPEATVRDLLALLAERRIGAAVVCRGGTTVEGIASERDVVRAVHERGAAALDEPVSAIATSELHTAGPTTTVDELMRMMTTQRVRHVPVIKDGALAGLVSIGDVVKSRIDELERETSALSDYISTAR